MGCRIEGCTKPVRPQGTICGMHYHRRYRTGSYDLIPPTMYPCVVDGCDKTMRYEGRMCKIHYNRVRSSGRVWVRTPSNYHTMHAHIARHRGSAKQYACYQCGIPAQQWAYDHADPNEQQSPVGPWSPSLDHYNALCVPCHKRMDLRHLRQMVRSGAHVSRGSCEESSDPHAA